MSDNETSGYVNLKPLKVFVCGGGNVVDRIFYEEAYKLGKGLAEMDVAYGQGGLVDRRTIMGESYWGYIENGGQQTKLIVREGFKDELPSNIYNYENIQIVEDLAELAREQFIWADVIVIMPGGTGTIAELFCHIDFQLEYKKHPKIILFNQPLKDSNFFKGLLSQIKSSIDNGLISNNSYYDNIIIKSSIEDILLEIKQEKSRIYSGLTVNNGRKRRTLIYD